MASQLFESTMQYLKSIFGSECRDQSISRSAMAALQYPIVIAEVSSKLLFFSAEW